MDRRPVRHSRTPNRARHWTARSDVSMDRSSPLVPIVVIISVSAAFLAVASGELMDRAKEIAEGTASSRTGGQGPPCPPLPSDPRARLDIVQRHAFEFNGVQFFRQFGQADCSIVSAGANPFSYGLMCRFTSPATLAVTVNRKTYRFQPGIGRPAAVYVANGAVTCEISR